MLKYKWLWMWKGPCEAGSIATYSDSIPNCNEIVAKNVREQYCDLKWVAAQKLKTDRIRHFTDFINDALKDNQFHEIQILLDIYGTFQTWSADCGSGFSLINLIKSKSRNRLKVGHFDNLTRIKSYNSSTLNNNRDDVHKHFVTNKDRREKLPTMV